MVVLIDQILKALISRYSWSLGRCGGRQKGFFLGGGWGESHGLYGPCVVQSGHDLGSRTGLERGHRRPVLHHQTRHLLVAAEELLLLPFLLLEEVEGQPVDGLLRAVVVQHFEDHHRPGEAEDQQDVVDSVSLVHPRRRAVAVFRVSHGQVLAHKTKGQRGIYRSLGHCPKFEPLRWKMGDNTGVKI